MLTTSLLRAVSPAGQRGRLSVLIFHRVLSEPDPLFPQEMHARQFDRVCSWLKVWFNILPLDHAVAQLKSGALPARAACITFDDGYADNYEVALPLLKKHHMPATFFISTGFLDGGCMWNDTVIEAVRLCKLDALDLGDYGCYRIDTWEEKRTTIDEIIRQLKYMPADERLAAAMRIADAAHVTPREDLMMTSGQVLSMRRAQMQIGAHTVSHPILARLSATQARAEISGSKEFLEHLLGERVGLFAYPNGKPGEDYEAQTVEIVRDLGFDAAVSTQWGAAKWGADMWQIPRFTPWDREKLPFLARLIGNLRRR